MLKSIMPSVLCLILFAANAIAQNVACGGKTVYLQLPLEGWSKTTIYIYWEGNIRTVSAQRQGDYSVFTFPTLPNDGGSIARTFSLSMKSTDIDVGNNWIASGSRYNIGGARPSDAQGISCNSFGTGSTVYIYPNPSSPSQTMVTTTPPNAYNFYFLPPGNPEWVLGHPYLVWLDANNTLQKVKLDIDPARCGWYKYTWFNAEPPSRYAWIWLNDTRDDQLGDLGLDEDPNDWIDGLPTPFNLMTRFNNGPGDLFFMPSKNRQIWGTSDYGEVGICSYNFAALIYDTDKSVNPSFTLYSDDIGCGSNTWGPFASGIVKGMVKQNLNPETRKIECDQCTDRCGAFSSEQAFKDAFDPKSNTNVVVNYDMPFTRNSKGLWEFDSDKMLNHSGQVVGGFYPEILQNKQMAVAAGADYSQCPTCDTKYKAESFVNLVSTIDESCFERGLTTIATGDCGPAYGAGDFSTGDNPADTWGATPSGSVAWNQTWRENQINLWGGPNRGANAETNAFFCFESHAEFTYEKGQEFFIRGDDDIWVYMNNKLVVDLGGSHFPAPGYVNLDNLGLTEGEKYPIDIFFCDRRTTMSNIRITTNMYFAEKNMLSLRDSAEVGLGAQLCIDYSISEKKCGKDMGNILDYYMLNRREDQMDLNPSNPNCDWRGADLVCYGGITLTNYPNVERIKVDKFSMRGLAGTYKIYAKIKDFEVPNYPNATSVLITSLTSETTSNVVWGKIINSMNGQLIYDLGPKHKETVSGKPVPIGFAAGAWQCDDQSKFGTDGCLFEVFMENYSEGGSYNAPVQINVRSDPGYRYSYLTAYTDSIPSESSRVQLNQGLFTIPGPGQKHFPGLLVLWVAGEYEAESDEMYTINNGPTIKVLLPRLGFIDPSTSTALNSPNQTKGSDPSLGGSARDMAVMIGTNLPKAVAAYDISNNQRSLCTTCNFPLNMNAWITAPNGDSVINISSLYIMQSLPGMINLENGIAKFEVRGARQVEPDSFAHFTIRGPSLNRDTYAKWDSLLFSMPDAPYPYTANIYDRNGNGIGDSLYIAYSRRFPLDSLPSTIQIIWDYADTLVFGLGHIDPSANMNYWNGSDKGFNLNLRDSIIEIYGGEFSKSIKTHAGSVNAQVISWATVRDSKNQNAVVDLSMTSAIQDKIPAIVVRASYFSDETPDCGTWNVKCRDEVMITLSEPVKSVRDISGDAARAPFAYKLRNRDWNVYMESKDLPARMRWTKSGGTEPNGINDSMVTFTYQSYKEIGDTTWTPEASDSVKFASMKFGYFALTDLEGNEPNQNEIGRRLEGINRFAVNDVQTAYLDQKRDIIRDALNDVKYNYRLGLFNNVNVDTLFTPSKPVTFLPVPEEWAASQSPPDSIKKYYPGSVGLLINPDVYNNVNNIMQVQVNGYDISSDDITFYSQAYYYSSPGNFLVESEPIRIKCTDPIFQIRGYGDCLSNRTANYFAWNLKNDRAQMVNAGAYIAVIDFYWEVKYRDWQGKEQIRTFDKFKRKYVFCLGNESDSEKPISCPDAPEIFAQNSNQGFNVKRIGGKTYHVQADNMLVGSNAKIEVYNLNGEWISQHNLVNGQANITVPSTGSYIMVVK